MRIFLAVSIICSVFFQSVSHGVDKQFRKDREALIQIDKDIDINNLLNWNQLPDNTNPGDGGKWDFVTWSEEPEARVITINFYFPSHDNGYSGYSNAFGDLEKLKWLIIADEGTITGLGDLSKLSELHHIRLWNNKLSSLGGIAEAKNLEYLDLRSNCISDVSGASKLKKLKTLILFDNCLVNAEGIESLCSLEALSIGKNNIEKFDMSNMISLQGFSCSYNKLSDLGDFKNLKEIKGMELNRNRLSELKGFENLPKLKTLDVDHNRLPLSQLIVCMYVPNLHLGTQTDVALPSLSPPLFTGKEYDLRSEHLFLGKMTEFSLFSENERKEAVPDVDYRITDGVLVFLNPGEYVLSMYNEAIHSQGKMWLVDREIIREPFIEEEFREETDVRFDGESVDFSEDAYNPYKSINPPAMVKTEVLVVRD